MNKPNKEKMISLVESAQKGDRHAFSEIYESYIVPIFRFIYFRVRSRADAEDLTQNVFLKAWNSLDDYKQNENPFSSWLYAIARNTVIDFWRKKKEWSIGDLRESGLKDDGRPLEELIDEQQDLMTIKKIMELLNEEQQEVMILKFIEGLSGREISKIMDKKEDAVRQLQSRAIKTLKSYLKEL